MTPTPKVVSLHVHPASIGERMIDVAHLDLVADQGILQDKRYFRKLSRSGTPGKRQVTLIEREQIAAHAAALQVADFAPGEVRANIETEGIALVPLRGEKVQIGSAVLLIGAPRDPCDKMDRLAPGLRELMDHGRQGVLAQVVVSGTIQVGDEIRVCS